ncbi:MAG TPA: tRNA uridine-5-carboxymethylaminomethyl(34) synthesis GTPase MnmE [Candidatus Binatia bacterium]
MYQEDTIAAIATAMGEGGVAIVRISGPNAEKTVRAIFVRSRQNDIKLRSHMLYQGSIRDPHTDLILDQVLVTIMRQPHSYTGEDVAEIHCHGGAFLVQRILGVVLAQGVRHAERGEFTKRAFLNGRMDLSQAEAVLDLIRARTDQGIQLAVQNAEGVLSKWVGDLREELIDILVQVEAAIDFPEEDIELSDRAALIAKIAALREKIGSIISTYRWGRLFKEGARVCICGRPNVGKSSLLNALVGDNRVIVSAIPGTTRDVIEESLNLDGLPVVLWDTAGIRETEDEVEKAGVGLSLEHIANADVVIAVLDGSESLTQEDISLLLNIDHSKSLVAVNKSDLQQQLDLIEARHMFTSSCFVPVCAKDGTGIDGLKSKLRQFLLGKSIESPVILNNLRHKNSLLRGQDVLATAIMHLERSDPPDIVAISLQEARESFEEVVGMVTSEDVLERIFSSFCIGK